MGMLKKAFIAVVDSANKQNARNQYAKSKKTAVSDAKNNKAPDRCPQCQNAGNWHLIGVPKQGFSLGKATAALFGAGVQFVLFHYGCRMSPLCGVV